MKYSTNELLKNGYEPFLIQESVDFSSIAATHHEIRAISLVSINGIGHLVDEETVLFKLTIDCKVTLPCAITLVDVLYPIHIETEEYFSFAPDAKEDENRDVTIVKGQTIELAPVIWENIVVNIPIRVISANAYEHQQKQGDNWQIVDENEKNETIDPRFAILKDLLKK